MGRESAEKISHSLAPAATYIRTNATRRTRQCKIHKTSPSSTDGYATSSRRLARALAYLLYYPQTGVRDSQTTPSAPLHKDPTKPKLTRPAGVQVGWHATCPARWCKRQSSHFHSILNHHSCRPTCTKCNATHCNNMRRARRPKMRLAETTVNRP